MRLPQEWLSPMFGGRSTPSAGPPQPPATPAAASASAPSSAPSPEPSASDTASSTSSVARQAALAAREEWMERLAASGAIASLRGSDGRGGVADDKGLLQTALGGSRAWGARLRRGEWARRERAARWAGSRRACWRGCAPPRATGSWRRPTAAALARVEGGGAHSLVEGPMRPPTSASGVSSSGGPRPTALPPTGVAGAASTPRARRRERLVGVAAAAAAGRAEPQAHPARGAE